MGVAVKDKGWLKLKKVLVLSVAKMPRCTRWFYLIKLDWPANSWTVQHCKGCSLLHFNSCWVWTLKEKLNSQGEGVEGGKSVCFQISITRISFHSNLVIQALYLRCHWRRSAYLTSGDHATVCSESLWLDSVA